ncbi:MAG: 3-hydroxyacyl-ACP dehydratase FabZ [Sphingobacteriales bacterium]|nr:3-hydroxyacyl-ACP dehydratase FabZ [Sphingobacteriales bacterium]
MRGHSKPISKTTPLQAIPKYDPNLPTVYDVRRIMQSLPHRYPFLLVDKIVSLTDKQVVGIKNVTMNEEFFQGHFPGHPIMPGVMIVEAMAQIGGVMMFHSIENPEQYVTYFLRIEQAKFRYPVIPGDTLVLQLSIVSPLRRGICELAGLAYVGSRLVAEANFAAQIVKNKSIKRYVFIYLHKTATIFLTC